MTPDSKQQEYIISEKLTKEIEENLKDLPGCISARIPRVIRGRIYASESNPSKKRRDAWKWTTCKGCKFKKDCDDAMPYMPPCGRDYDEELANLHDAATRVDEREWVLKALTRIRDMVDDTKDLSDTYREEGISSCVQSELSDIMKEIDTLSQSLRSSTPLPEDAGKDGE